MSPSILSDLLKNLSFGKPKDKQPDSSDSTPLSLTTTVVNESQKSESSAHPFRLGNFSVDEYKPLKVVVIGAGFSGIVAGIRFRQKIPSLNLTIYDKNSGIGGTWYTNKYPGLACDIPSHSYQLTFEEKTDWSAFYAPGPEILSYLQGVVSKYKLGPYINLQHELVHAKYDEASGKWVLKIRRPKTQVNSGSDGDANADPASVEYEEVEDTADLLFAGVGALSRWSWPDIEGLDTFQGRLVHSAQWDVEGSEGGSTWEEGVKDWKDKKVGVIGVGSSAIQIVPALRPRVSRLFNYVRGKTWLSPPFSVAKMAELIQRDPTGDNYAFTDKDKERFKDPEYYKLFRHEIENDLNSVHLATLKDTPMQKGARTAFKENMIKRLEKKPWIADHLIPDFGVACRRLTPGPGYLEALCEDNVDFVNVGIKRVMEGGIETMDGKVQELDVIVCATGYDTTFHLPFPIIGKNGISLQDKWTPHPTTYLSTCIDDFPNYFFSLGPNSAVGSGSLLAVIEHQVDYAVMVGMKMQRERLKSVVVKKGAVEDFDEYLEHYFPTSVYSEKCRSWYKMGKEEGRVVALWPGSCLHALRALRYPRWEDFEYELDDDDDDERDGVDSRRKVRNRFYWLGDGSTFNEKNMSGDRAWYLNEGYVDFPPGE